MQDSYVQGLAKHELRYVTVGAALSRRAALQGEDCALVSTAQGRRLSWSEIDALSGNLAANLLDLGLSPGDRVGIWAPNCWEWTVAQFATAKAGIILVNINPAYRLHELEYALRKVGCAGLILADRFKSSDFLGMIGELAPELQTSQPGSLHAARLPALRHVIRLDSQTSAGMHNFEALCAPVDKDARARLADIAATLTPDDPINIQFTSGTTGSPKGATLSHHNIVNNGFFVGAALGLGADDRVCIPVPLYHCFGMVMGNLACAMHGATMVYPAPSFDPLATLEAVASERCTALYGVPTMFIAQLDHPSFAEFDLTSLRTGIMAGAPCPMEVMKKVVSDFHMPEITIAYGMTETSPVSFQTERDAPHEKRVSTVGTIHPHVEVKIIDEEGRLVERGTEGELCTRGYSVMSGYWGEEEKTKETIDGGRWLHTGDLAIMDEEGYVRISGRLKDMIIRGGENIYPREIEEFLLAHPDIADVQVFGVPDPKYGEEVCAWVRARVAANRSEEAVREYCKGRIAHYKIPRYVRFVDEFPLTVTGKPQKFLMREAMAAELG